MLLNNLWGVRNAGKTVSGPGYSCSHLNSYATPRAGVAESVSWTMAFNWETESVIKGYTSVGLIGPHYQLSKIASLKTFWSYTLTTPSPDDLKCNVAYDLFLSASDTVGAPHTAEIMLWIRHQGFLPVAIRDSKGHVIFWDRYLHLEGYRWALYHGNGRHGLPVYSFVIEAEDPVPGDFKADLKPFLDFLLKKKHIKSTHYLAVLQAGSEVYKGTDVTIKTSKYGTTVKTK